MNTLIIKNNNIFVRKDDNGLYNLNDLHQSAVAARLAKDWQVPSQFLKFDGTKKFVQEVSKGRNRLLEANQVLTVIHGGVDSGTWALELIALRYAAWLSPAFEVKVYEVFQGVMHDRLRDEIEANKVKMQYQIGKMSASEAGNRLRRWGLGGEKRQLEEKLEFLSLKLEYAKAS